MSLDRLPDWAGPVTETLSWTTAVTRSRDGSEERRCNRPAPRRDIAFAAHVDARSDLEFHGDDYGGTLIRWLPGATYPQTLGNGVTQIDVADRPDHLGFEVGREALVVSPDGTLQQTTVTALVLAGTPSVFVDVGVDIVLGDVFVPAVAARLDRTFNLDRPSASLRRGEVSFLQTESARWPEAGGVDEFDLTTGLEVGVETFEPEAGAELVEVFYRAPSLQAEAVSRRLEQLDTGLGSIDIREIDGITRVAFSQTYELFSRAEIWSMRRMLYRRRGRFEPVFVPAGHHIRFIGTTNHGGTDYWVLEDNGWASAVPDARFGLVLHRADGTRSYHLFEELADESHATLPVPAGEAWVVNPYPAATSLDAADVRAADWLVYVRLESDVAVLRYSSALTASIELDWVPVPWPSSWPVAS